MLINSNDVYTFKCEELDVGVFAYDKAVDDIIFLLDYWRNEMFPIVDELKGKKYENIIG